MTERVFYHHSMTKMHSIKYFYLKFYAILILSNLIGLGNFRAYLVLGKFLTNFGQKFKISKHIFL